MRIPTLLFGRTLALVSLLVVALALSACTQDTAGPEVGADVEDLQNELAVLEEDFTALEERVGVLEEGDVAEPAVEEPLEEDALADPDAFVGEQVTVSAEVEEILSTSAFTLDGALGPLLVVQATGSGDNEIIEQGAPVQVAGTVRENFVVTEFEEEFGVELEDELFADFESQTYIVADGVSEPQAA